MSSFSSGMQDLGTGIPFIGGLFDDSDDKAMEQIQNNQRLWGNLQMPELGWDNFTPENTQYQTVREDPAALLAQSRAMAQQKTLADEGLGYQDKLAFMQAQGLGEGIQKRSREAALQNAAARGVGGSGMEFAMGEMGRQDAAERARKSAMEQAAESSRGRALNQQAYTQNLGNQRNQNYRTQAANTGIINNFNKLNTQNRNDAFQYNQAGRNNTAQQGFANQVSRINGLTGANTQVADTHAAKNAERTDNRNQNTQIAHEIGMSFLGGGSGGGGGGGGGAAGGMMGMFSDVNLKTNIAPGIDGARELLSHLKPYAYNYKDQAHGYGDFVGVMAQDLEKSEIGRQAVIETPEGKMVAYQRLVPMMLGMMSEQQRKIDKLEELVNV